MAEYQCANKVEKSRTNQGRAVNVGEWGTEPWAWEQALQVFCLCRGEETWNKFLCTPNCCSDLCSNLLISALFSQPILLSSCFFAATTHCVTSFQGLFYPLDLSLLSASKHCIGVVKNLLPKIAGSLLCNEHCIHDAVLEAWRTVHTRKQTYTHSLVCKVFVS